MYIDNPGEKVAKSLARPRCALISLTPDDDSDDDESDDDGKIELDGALRRGTEDAAGVEGMSEQEIVNINLDFCDPNERFFHGVRSGTTMISGPRCMIQPYTCSYLWYNAGACRRGDLSVESDVG